MTNMIYTINKLVLATPMWDRWVNRREPHFSDREAETEGLDDLPRATQQDSGSWHENPYL